MASGSIRREIKRLERGLAELDPFEPPGRQADWLAGYMEQWQPEEGEHMVTVGLTALAVVILGIMAFYWYATWALQSGLR